MNRYLFDGAATIGQNRAFGQERAEVAFMPGYTGIDNARFQEMRTPQDQVHWLYLYGQQLKKAISALGTDLDELAETLESAWESYADAAAAGAYQKAKADIAIASQEAQDSLNRAVASLQAEIDQITVALDFPVADPTHGQAKRLVSVALESVYDFDRVFALTAADHDSYQLTAKRLDALSIGAREYDVAGTVKFFNKVGA